MSADVTPVLRAIEAARFRLEGLSGIALAAAATGEMIKIIAAKDAYDQAFANEHTGRVLAAIFPEGLPW